MSATRVAELSLELVDREVDDRVATLVEVGDHLRADARLDQEDAVLEAEMGLVVHGDVLADEGVRDVADLLDVAGHDDSSEVDVRVAPYASSEYTTMYTNGSF